MDVVGRNAGGASRGLDRFPQLQRLFQEPFGPLSMPIADFTNGPGSIVAIVDPEQRLPELFVSWPPP